jgi:hypothetical protein
VSIESIESRLERLESLILSLVEREKVKDWYSTAEVAKILGKSDYTVREWARLGRIRARKRACGHGKSKEWMVDHEELTRLRNEGLLPFRSSEQ